MQSITSAANALYKEVKNLKQKKFRDERGEYLIEGIRFVDEAIKANAEIKSFFFSERLENANGGAELLERITASNCAIYELSDHLMDGICDTENSQGVVAILSIKKCRPEDFIPLSKKLLILESIQDPGNLGTIIRTADAAGFDGVIALSGCVDIYNPKVLRATMGSVFHIQIADHADMAETISLIKSSGLKTFAAHLKGEKSIYEADMSAGGVILIGNEANGLSEELASQADELVKIPMPGKAESLNASIASALFMYEMVRQDCNK